MSRTRALILVWWAVLNIRVAADPAVLYSSVHGPFGSYTFTRTHDEKASTGTIASSLCVDPYLGRLRR